MGYCHTPALQPRYSPKWLPSLPWIEETPGWDAYQKLRGAERRGFKRCGRRVLRFSHKEYGTPHAKMYWSRRRLCRKIVESVSFPKMYYSMPINMFFVVKFIENLILRATLVVGELLYE
jgi:hypothetical protein